MADLPEDSSDRLPPLTDYAVDYFGPFTIKEGRKEIKRYRVLFTCLASTAVHLETSSTLAIGALINSLSRFIYWSGPMRRLRSDQGATFVGAKHELKSAVAELHNERIRRELLQENCDWITFIVNVPSSSHMGGVWEHLRRVQQLANEFLTRWRKENLLSLQQLRETYVWMTSSLSKTIMPPVIGGNLHALSQLTKALMVVSVR